MSEELSWQKAIAATKEGKKSFKFETDDPGHAVQLIADAFGIHAYIFLSEGESSRTMTWTGDAVTHLGLLEAAGIHIRHTMTQRVVEKEMAPLINDIKQKLKKMADEAGDDEA